MAKNRKAHATVARFGPAIVALIVCFVIGGTAIGYVWEKNQLHGLGREIKERENRLGQLQRENKIRADHLATLVSPPVLDARVKRMNLGLVQPALSQIVRLVETPTAAVQNEIREPQRLFTQAAR
jgi:hypothetical protein